MYVQRVRPEQNIPRRERHTLNGHRTITQQQRRGARNVRRRNSVRVPDAHTHADGCRQIVQRAQRRKTEPATTAVPPRSIMPRYDPPSEWRIAPAAGPPQSALCIK